MQKGSSEGPGTRAETRQQIAVRGADCMMRFQNSRDASRRQEYGVTSTEEESMGLKLASFSSGRIAAEGNHKGK